MIKPSIASGLALVLAAGLATGNLACTALSAAGNGGWSPARREQELVRAKAMTSPQPEPAAGSDADHSISSNPPSRRTLDLATALDLAERHNRSIAVAGARVEAAAGDVAVSRAALLPTNSVRGGYTWYSDEQTSKVDLDPNLLPPGTAPPVVTVREQDFATASAAVRLALDVSGELRHRLGAAQAGYRAEQARAWATRLDEERAVMAAYFGLLEAHQLRDVEAQTIALHERQLHDASARFDQGRLTRNEVLVVEVALSNSRQLLMLLDNAVAAQRRSLNKVTGLEVSAPTEAIDVGPNPSLPAIADALASARTSNPLTQSMLEEVAAADERLTAARRSRFPRFAAVGGFDATTSDTLSPKDYGSVGVTVDLDLGSFAREGEIARLDAASRASRLMLDRSAREIEDLVHDSFDRVRERLAAIEAATVAVGQAEENERIRRSQFDEGRATSEDLLDAAELLTRQRALLASARYQAHIRRAELQQLMGVPLSDLVSPPARDHTGEPTQVRTGEPRG